MDSQIETLIYIEKLLEEQQAMTLQIKEVEEKNKNLTKKINLVAFLLLIMFIILLVIILKGVL